MRGSSAKQISEGNGLIVQKGSYLATVGNISSEVFFQKKLGKGLFGGEGLFNTVITGPGKVILQSMPISSTAMKLYQYMPHPSAGN